MQTQTTSDPLIEGAALEMLSHLYQRYVTKQRDENKRETRDAARWLKQQLENAQVAPSHLTNAIEKPELATHYAREAAWELIAWVELSANEYDGGYENHIHTIMSHARDLWPGMIRKQEAYTGALSQKMTTLSIRRSHALETALSD